MAWMPIRAAARRESRRRSPCAWLPSPGGRPQATTSTTPPSVSPAFFVASISAIIARLVSGSRQRTSDLSTVPSSPGCGISPYGLIPQPGDEGTVDKSEVRCLDPETSLAMIAEIDATKKAGDTLGGVVEVVAWGLPPGLGSHAHGDRRLDARLAAALMGIQAIKGVEVGDGFGLARLRGSQAHDEIVRTDGVIRRITARSGGTEGGMSTGELLRVRAAMKPISTVPRALQTVDTATGEAAIAINQRSDVCAVPAAGIVAEAMVAMVLTDAALEKFGGDSVIETRRNVQAYLRRLDERGLTPATTV